MSYLDGTLSNIEEDPLQGTKPLDQKIIPIYTQDCLEIDAINSSSKTPEERWEMNLVINYIKSFVDWLAIKKELLVEIVNIDGDGLKILGSKEALNAVYLFILNINNGRKELLFRAVAQKNPKDGTCIRYIGNNPLIYFPGLQSKMAIAKEWTKDLNNYGTYPDEYFFLITSKSTDLVEEFNQEDYKSDCRTEQLDNSFLCIVINQAGTKGGIYDFKTQVELSEEFQTLLRTFYLVDLIDLKISVDAGRVFILISPRAQIDEFKVENFINQIKHLLLKFSSNHIDLAIDIKVTSAKKIIYPQSVYGKVSIGEEFVDYDSIESSVVAKMEPALLHKENDNQPKLFIVYSNGSVPSGEFHYGEIQEYGRRRVIEAIPLNIETLNDFINNFLSFVSEEYSLEVMFIFASRIQDLIIGGQNSLLHFKQLATEIEHYYYFKLKDKVRPEENSKEFLVAKFTKLSEKFKEDSNLGDKVLIQKDLEGMFTLNWTEVCRILSIIKSFKGNIKVDYVLAKYLDIELDVLDKILILLHKYNLVFYNNDNLLVPDYLSTANIRAIKDVSKKDADYIIFNVSKNLDNIPYDLPLLELAYDLAKKDSEVYPLIAKHLIKSQIANGRSIKLGQNTDEDFDLILIILKNKEDIDVINFYKYSKLIESAIKKRNISEIETYLDVLIEIDIEATEDAEIIILTYRIIEAIEGIDNVLLKDKLKKFKNKVAPKRKRISSVGMIELIELGDTKEKEMIALALSLDSQNIHVYFPTSESMLSFLNYFINDGKKLLLKKRYLYLILLKLINELFLSLRNKKTEDKIIVKELIEKYFNFLSKEAPFFPDLITRYSVNLTPLFFNIYRNNSSAILEHAARGLIESLVTQNKRLIFYAYNNYLMVLVHLEEDNQLKEEEIIKIADQLVDSKNNPFRFFKTNRSIYFENYSGMQISHTMLLLLRKYNTNDSAIRQRIVNLAFDMWSCILRAPFSKTQDIVQNIAELIIAFPEFYKDLIQVIPLMAIKTSNDLFNTLDYLEILVLSLKEVLSNFSQEDEKTIYFESLYQEALAELLHFLADNQINSSDKIVSLFVRNSKVFIEKEFESLVKDINLELIYAVYSGIIENNSLNLSGSSKQEFRRDLKVDLLERLISQREV